MNESKQILLVHDEPKRAKLFKRILERCGAGVTCVTGEEELSQALESQTYSHLITSLRLPWGGRASEFLRRLNLEETPVKIVILSPTRSSAAEAKFKRLGAWAYLPEPVYAQDLKQLLGLANATHEQESAK